MITRPLGLASRLRPEPRNFDALFLVNGGLIVLFFSLFGSRFVLAPGLGVDFVLPQVSGARGGAAMTTHRITVTRSGLIITDVGPADLRGLSEWLKIEGKKTRRPSLLMQVSEGVQVGDLSKIWNAAHEAGFTVLWAADEPTTISGAGL